MIFLDSLNSTLKADHVWIGGNTIFRGGTFEWATTQKLLYPFTDMAPGEPNRGKENIVLCPHTQFL